MPFASCSFVLARMAEAVNTSKAYTDTSIAGIPTNIPLLTALGPALAPYLCPHCTTPTPACTLTVGGAFNDNAGVRVGSIVNCPVADRATYIAQGFAVLTDNAGNFLTMARTTAGDTCSISFTVALRDNSNAIIGYIPA